MVIDSSAIIAILLEEAEQEQFAKLIGRSSTRLMSIVSWVETAIALESKKIGKGSFDIDLMIARLGIEIVPVDLAQGEIAREAWRRYGRGRHTAALNFGDCFSYALAVTSGEPLLFKGTDFAKTDVNVATDV